MIHRITPRFKSLLHEMHHVGNATHGMLFSYLPVIAIMAVLLVGGILTAAGDNEDGMVEVRARAKRACAEVMWKRARTKRAYLIAELNLYSSCTVLTLALFHYSHQRSRRSQVPVWGFAALFQPLITMLAYIAGYGNLNLAIERDVDQVRAGEAARAVMLSFPPFPSLPTLTPASLSFPSHAGHRGDEHQIDLQRIARPQLVATGEPRPFPYPAPGLLQRNFLHFFC